MKRLNSIKYFTLLEVVIVISLLSIVGGFGAVKVAHFLQERTYHIEEKVVESRYHLASRAATLCNTHLTLSFEEKGLCLSENRKVPKGIKSLIERPLKNSKKETSSETFSPYGPPTSDTPCYPHEAPLSPC